MIAVMEHCHASFGPRRMTKLALQQSGRHNTNYENQKSATSNHFNEFQIAVIIQSFCVI
jgi:hypothetical protein